GPIHPGHVVAEPRVAAQLGDPRPHAVDGGDEALDTNRPGKRRAVGRLPVKPPMKAISRVEEAERYAQRPGRLEQDRPRRLVGVDNEDFPTVHPIRASTPLVLGSHRPATAAHLRPPLPVAVSATGASP